MLELLFRRDDIHLNFEAKILNHSPDVCRRLARRREIPVYKDGIRRIERQWLKASEVVFPPAGNTEFRPWM